MLSGFQKVFLSLAVASAVAFVGATPLSQIAGFYKPNPSYQGENTPILTTSGAILFFLTVAVMGPLLRLGAAAVAGLQQAPSRPSSLVSLALIACGTLCVISSLAMAWSGRPVAQSADLGQFLHSMGGNPAGGQFTPQMSMNLNTQAGSPGPMILTVLVFLLGSVLLAIGVWASIHRPPAPGLAGESRAIKAPVPELAEMPG